jgi:hypothetical protein
MKECRFTKYDILSLPVDPSLVELQVNERLLEEGFDLDKDVVVHYDFLKNEYVCRQSE